MGNSKHIADDEEMIKPDWFRRFGIWCSGASTEALFQCPTEWNKFAINGYIILLTAVLSFISGSYFLSFVFPEQKTISILFGAVWAFLIFTLDRSIIVSIKKTDVFWQEFRQGSIRIVLAIFIGMVVATPIELRLFKNEIVAKVEENSNKRKEEVLQQDGTNLGMQLAPKRQRLVELEKIKAAYEKAEQDCIEEIEGRSRTGRIGHGPAWAEKDNVRIQKKQEWEKSQPEYYSLQEEIRRLINNQNRAENVLLEKENIDGVEARVKALYQLSGLHWFVTFLFILIECLPVITKLMNKRGPYDETLERIEYEKLIEQKEIISRKNSEINELLKQAEEAAKLTAEIKSEIVKDKLDTELRTNKVILDDLAKKQEELALMALNEWFSAEKARVASTYVKIKPVLENIRWKAINLADETYYLFNSDRTLEYTESGTSTTGKWEYTITGKEISIELPDIGIKEIYALKNFTSNNVDLEGSTTIKLSKV
jgi:hypothetical protein